MAKHAVVFGAEPPREDECKVIDLEAWRRRRPTRARSEPSLPEAQIEAGGRGDLYVRIGDDGSVDYGVENVEIGDAPAMILASMLLCMRLVTQIDEQGFR